MRTMKLNRILPVDLLHYGILEKFHTIPYLYLLYHWKLKINLNIQQAEKFYNNDTILECIYYGGKQSHSSQ